MKFVEIVFIGEGVQNQQFLLTVYGLPKQIKVIVRAIEKRPQQHFPVRPFL